MKSFITILLFTFSFSFVLAQKKETKVLSDTTDLGNYPSQLAEEPSQQEDNEIFIGPLSKNPEFKGGVTKMKAYIDSSMKSEIKEKIKSDKIIGKVYIMLVIDKTGKLLDPKISKKLNPIVDEEVLRIFNTMPNWIPAENNGQKVSIKINIPVTIGS
jgi:hypothetical protein